MAKSTEQFKSLMEELGRAPSKDEFKEKTGLSDWTYYKCKKELKTDANEIGYLNIGYLRNEEGILSVYVWSLLHNDQEFCGTNMEDLWNTLSHINNSSYSHKIIFVNKLYHFYMYSSNLIAFHKLFATGTTSVMELEIDNLQFRDFNGLTDGKVDYLIDNVVDEEKVFSIINSTKEMKEKIAELNPNENWNNYRYSLSHYCNKCFLKEMNGFRNYFGKIASNLIPDHKQYRALRMAKRDGILFVNPYYKDRELKNVQSWDISSFYPSVFLEEEFPLGEMKEEEPLVENVFKYLGMHKPFITIVELFNLKLKDDGFPWLNDTDGNPLMEAGMITGSFTDVDFLSILDNYKVSGISVKEFYSVSVYGHLDNRFKELIRTKYMKKQSGDKVSKFTINNMIGRMGQQAYYNTEYVFNEEGVIEEQKKYRLIPSQIDKELREFYRNKILPSQWAVWAYALARKRMLKVLREIGMDNVVYTDTDGIKFIGTEKPIIDYNNSILETCGIGKFKNEGPFDNFKVIGKKQYGYIKDEKIEIKMAGANKNVVKEFFKDKTDLSDLSSSMYIEKCRKVIKPLVSEIEEFPYYIKSIQEYEDDYCPNDLSKIIKNGAVMKQRKGVN